MLLRKLRLVNYGGIYNGMGLNEIEIDFSKCRNRIILIKGDNGTGKSTIMKALKPLPDDNTDFIPGVIATKEIEYFDEKTGIIYQVRFIHGINNKGTRDNAKGYFYKIHNGKINELNPSGNITSCKSVVYEQFQLDSSYLTLMQLSSGKRGLADMRPADRKKFVTGILNNVEVYNDMYKKLGKKSTVFKGLMNSIISKLNGLGDISMLNLELRDCEEVIKQENASIEYLMKERYTIESALRLYDPDGNIMNNLNNKAKEVEQCEDAFKSYLNDFEGEFGKDQDIHLYYQNMNLAEMKLQISDLTRSIENNKSKINKLLEEKDVESQQLSVKSEKYKSLTSDVDIKILEQKIKDTENYISSIINRLRGSGLKEQMLSLTKDEFVLALNTIKEASDSIMNSVSDLNNFPDAYRYSVLAYAIVHSNFDEDQCFGIRDENGLMFKNRKEAIETKFIYEQKLEEETKELDNYLSVKETIELTKLRPSNCNNDGCPFIKNSIDLATKWKHFDEIKCYTKIKDYKNYIKKISDHIEVYDTTSKAFYNIRNCITKINSISSILDRLEIKIDLSLILNNISKSFNIAVSEWKSIYLDTICHNIDKVNFVEEYNVYKEQLRSLKEQYSKYENQNDFIDLLINDINKLNEDLSKTTKIISELQDVINVEKQQLEITTTNIRRKERFDIINTNINNAKDELQYKKKEYEELVSKQKRFIEDYEKIESINNNLQLAREKINPKIELREDLKFRIRTVNQYIEELKTYQEQAEKIEVIKHFTSPTTGIQLLFASMYLNKIMDNANCLLANMFGGKFCLLPFVITESEFRIPVAVDGGLNHDDITSMSSAQIALISMVISISMLAQTSTSLNIINGDEIDAPFDAENRRLFFDTLLSLMNLIGANQCVLISHNSEYTQSDCDVIRLKTSDISSDTGNVIWSY